MRAIVYSTKGGPDVLQLVERPTPSPAPGQVLVKLAYSAVNPTDWKSRSSADPGREQTPNQDGAGTIEAVGEGVDPVLVGERVWVWQAAHDSPYGTAAEYTVVPARQTVLLGSEASFELAAALPIPFMTAHRCLTVSDVLPDRLDRGSLQDRTVLVTGGAGAVGNAAIQLARRAEATVIATVSGAEKAQLANHAGANHVINYREQDVAKEVKKIVPGGVDIIVEVNAAANAAVAADVIGLHGVVAIYAGTADESVSFPVRSQMTNNARWQFVLVYTEPERAKDIATEDIAAAVLDGDIRVGPDAGLPIHIYPLGDTAAAQQAVQDGAVGKVLIDVTA